MYLWLGLLIIVTSASNAAAWPPTKNHASQYGSSLSYYKPELVKGELDYIQSPHAKIWVAAYRLMNGLGMPDELAETPYRGYYRYLYNDDDEWAKKVASILDIAPSSQHYGYSCDFFHSLELLDKRIRELGAPHPYVKEWVQAQNNVYQNCSGAKEVVLPAKSMSIPNESKRVVQPKRVVQLRQWDRAYQMASAYFYSKDYEEALKRYQAIISDTPDSPHVPIAHYMIARTLMYAKKTQEAYDQLQTILKTPQLPAIHQDAADLLGVLAFKSEDSSYKAERFRTIIQPLIKPIQTAEDAKWLAENFQKLNREAWQYLAYHGPVIDEKTTPQERDFIEWLWSFVGEGQYIDNIHWSYLQTESPACARYCGKEKKKYCRSIDYCPYQHSKDLIEQSLEKWRTTGKLHWLVAVMLRLPHTHPQIDSILADFAAIQKSVTNGKAGDEALYAYPTLLHHAVRLMLHKDKDEEVEAILYPALEHQYEYAPRIAFHTAKYWITTGKRDKAEKLLDAVVAQKGFLNTAPYYELKLILADDLAEILRWGEEIEGNSYYREANFITPVADVLNLLPVKTLIELSHSDLLDTQAQIELSQVVWVRAILLAQYETADAMAKRIVEYIRKSPDYMTRDIRPLAPNLEKYLSTSDTSAKHREALLVLLKYPRLKPYVNTADYSPRYWDADLQQLSRMEAIDVYNHNDNNWWCVYDLKERQRKAQGSLYSPIYRGLSPNLAEQYKAYKDDALDAFPPFALIDETESRHLSSAGAATTYLPKSVLEWAKDINIFSRYWNGSDSPIPEALHRAVKVTRYGCTRDRQKGKYSQAAFKWLHDKYWFSDWKDETPYWFR